MEKTVEDLVVVHQSIGSEVPHGIAAEGQIGVVIGEVDDRSVIAGTDPAQLFVVGTSGGVRDATLIVPAAVDRHAQQERPGTELVQLAEKQFQIDPFLGILQCGQKSLLRADVSQPERFLANCAGPLLVVQSEVVVVGMRPVDCVRLPVQRRPIERGSVAR